MGTLKVKAYWLNWGIFWVGGAAGGTYLNAPDAWDKAPWLSEIDEIVYAFGMFGVVPQQPMAKGDPAYLPESPQTYSVWTMYPYPQLVGTDDPIDSQVFAQLKTLRDKYNKKITLGIGGWNFCQKGNPIGDISNTYFHDMTSDPTNRANFITSLVAFLNGGCNNPLPGFVFDGVELDWEYPGTPLDKIAPSAIASDFQNLHLLIRELRQKLSSNQSIAIDVGPFLSSAISIDNLPAPTGTSYPASMKSDQDFYQWLAALSKDPNGPDAIQVMTYDYYTVWSSGKTLPNTPFGACPTSGSGMGNSKMSLNSICAAATNPALNDGPCSGGAAGVICQCPPSWTQPCTEVGTPYACDGVTLNSTAPVLQVTIGPWTDMSLFTKYSVPFTVEEILCFFKTSTDDWKKLNPTAPTTGALSLSQSYQIYSRQYTVQGGDSLLAISKSFGLCTISDTTLFNELGAWNGFDATSLLPSDQVLNLPAVPLFCCTKTPQGNVIGPCPPTTGGGRPIPPAPSQTGYSVTKTLCGMITAGVDLSKVYCGLALYGHSYTGVKFTGGDPTANGLTATGPLPGGSYSGACGQANAGTLTYYEIAQLLKTTTLDPCTGVSGLTAGQNTTSCVPVAYNIADGAWVSYDDAASLKVKLNFFLQAGIAGVMAFAPQQDDFTNNNYPLMMTIVQNKSSS